MLPAGESLRILGLHTVLRPHLPLREIPEWKALDGEAEEPGPTCTLTLYGLELHLVKRELTFLEPLLGERHYLKCIGSFKSNNPIGRWGNPWRNRDLKLPA